MSLIGDAMAQAGFSSQLLTSMMGQKSGIVPQGRGGVEIREPDEDDMEPLVREKALDPNDDGTPADITDEQWASEEFQDLLHEYTKSKAGPSMTAEKERTCQYLRPNPAFVFKTKDRAGSKYFINVCGSIQVPKPAEITAEVLAMENPRVRIPLSLAAPREDTDRSGGACQVFDAVVHADVIKKCEAEGKEGAEMKQFVIELCLQWVEQKHELELARNISFPKGMKSKGTPTVQTIRANTNALVTPLDGKGNIGPDATPAKQETAADREVEPEYSVEVEASTVYRSAHVEATFLLPQLDSADSVILDHSSTRLFLKAKGVYRVTVAMPHALAKTGADAEYDAARRTLTVRLQVATAATERAEKEDPKSKAASALQPRNTLAMELD